MKFKLDFRNALKEYGQALAAMAKLVGLEPQQLLKEEVGIILKTCIARTKQVSVAKLRDSARLRALRGLGLTRGPLTINAGVKARFGMVWRRNYENGQYFPIYYQDFSDVPNQHFGGEMFRVSTALTDNAKKEMQSAVQVAKKTQGLARKSWITIADKAGINLALVKGGKSIADSSIGRARNATAKGGAERNNGAAIVQNSGGIYAITVINRLPYGSKIGLGLLLSFTVQGRTAYFVTAVKKGFDGSLEQATKLFPGWTFNK